MDLMHIDGDYVLHLVDETTRFSVTKLVGKRVTTEKVWNPIMQSGSFVYTGMAHTRTVDEEKSFMTHFESDRMNVEV